MDTQTVIAMLALAVSVLTLLRSERHQRQQAPREVQRRAVDQLAHALWTLHAVIEHADVRQPPNAVVSDAMTVFERDWQRWQHQLPGGVRHLRRTAREAMACCFGPPAVAGLDRGRQTPHSPPWTGTGGTSGAATSSTPTPASNDGSSPTGTATSTCSRITSGGATRTRRTSARASARNP